MIEQGGLKERSNRTTYEYSICQIYLTGVWSVQSAAAVPTWASQLAINTPGVHESRIIKAPNLGGAGEFWDSSPGKSMVIACRSTRPCTTTMSLENKFQDVDIWCAVDLESWFLD